MLKHNIKLFLRNLKKDKTFTLLNIIGLSVAFGVAILLGMTASFELSYNKFHKKIDNLYQVYSVEQTAKGGDISTSNPVPLVNALKSEVPGISKITRLLSENARVTYNKSELNLGTFWVDVDFFKMFTFPVNNGNFDNPLGEKSGIVLTKKAAKSLLGSTDVINKTVHILIAGKEQPFTITAVLKDTPKQSSLEFDMAIRFENHPSYTELKDSWTNRNHDVYVQLQEGVSIKQFEKSSIDFTNLHYKGEIEDNKRDGALPNVEGQFKETKLLPFKDAFFTSFKNGKAIISQTLPITILGVAFLILCIACVNFINMSIANSTNRLKEIGMRKTLGAPKKQLFFQFWGESLIVFVFSLGIGILLSKLFLNDFQTLFRTEVTFSDLASTKIIVGAILGVLSVSLIAGGYPALLLSKLNTLQALKGKLSVTSGNSIRNALIVLQFSIAILLISGTLVLSSQLKYMRNKDLGFNQEQVLAFPLDGKRDSYQAVQLLRNELQDNPNIISITGADNILGRGKDGSAYKSVLGFDYKGRGVKTNMLVVDYDYLETLDIELISGRNFKKQFANDNLSLVINETMAKELREENPLEAHIILDDSIKYHVIGVVKDYNFEKLDKEIAPITLFMNNDWELYYAYIKIAPENIAQTFDAVKMAWAKIEPNTGFKGSFLDENIDRTFKREKIMTTMITSGSIIAITLSCIGLFAMSFIIVTQRTKEIGIRKIVGASVSSIIYMLTKDFMKLILISFLLVFPLAWWLLNNWLERYVYRINLNVWFFIGAGIMVVVIALVTIGAKTVKAAITNPIKSLRTE